jgi:hypothetical protein
MPTMLKPTIGATQQPTATAEQESTKCSRKCRLYSTFLVSSSNGMSQHASHHSSSTLPCLKLGNDLWILIASSLSVRIIVCREGPSKCGEGDCNSSQVYSSAIAADELQHPQIWKGYYIPYYNVMVVVNHSTHCYIIPQEVLHRGHATPIMSMSPWQWRGQLLVLGALNSAATFSNSAQQDCVKSQDHGLFLSSRVKYRNELNCVSQAFCRWHKINLKGVTSEVLCYWSIKQQQQ